MGDPLSKEKGEQLDTSKKRSLIGHTLASASTPLSTLAHCRRPFHQSPYFSGGCEALFLRKQHCVGVPMKLLAFQILLVLVLLKAGTASPPKGRKRRDPTNEEGDSYTVLNLGNYVPDLDNYDEVIDLSDYEGLMDYGDQLPEVKAGSSLGPPTRIGSTQSTVNPRTLSSKPTMTKPTMLGLPGSPSSHAEPGLPTCLVCVCLGSSVYCDDADLESIPPLPKTTTYLYARFNRISRIRAGDFKGLTKLKKIDLSSNSISSIDDDALRLLPALRDLILPENQLAALPMLPAGIEVLDVRLNRLQSSGIQPEAFRHLMAPDSENSSVWSKAHSHIRHPSYPHRMPGSHVRGRGGGGEKEGGSGRSNDMREPALTTRLTEPIITLPRLS
ncbi:opticin isoform X2 [Prionailurus bengalensis]|uniref:opticin isoform X2 n=1 Tax=Prionailurus bengalensis TaxID=37029 RepID=UPI001CA925DD|nr:opticin isoform X2 [Prionailurus bengalensis]